MHNAPTSLPTKLDETLISTHIKVLRCYLLLRLLQLCFQSLSLSLPVLPLTPLIPTRLVQLPHLQLHLHKGGGVAWYPCFQVGGASLGNGLVQQLLPQVEVVLFQAPHL